MGPVVKDGPCCRVVVEVGPCCRVIVEVGPCSIGPSCTAITPIPAPSNITFNQRFCLRFVPRRNDITRYKPAWVEMNASKRNVYSPFGSVCVCVCGGGGGVRNIAVIAHVCECLHYVEAVSWFQRFVLLANWV